MASEEILSCPVRQVDAESFYVTSYEEVKHLLTDERFSAQPRRLSDLEVVSAQTIGISMQLCDPPQHTSLRRFVSDIFSARRCELLRPTVLQIVDRLLTNIQAHAGGDLVADVAYPLPFTVICTVLGVPKGDRDEVLRIAEESLTAVGSEQVNFFSKKLTDYFGQLLDYKSAHPKDDICTELALAWKSGRLSYDEAVGTARLLLIAGYETTVSFIANSGLVLFFDKNYQRKLRNDQSLIPSAVEELLRYISPAMVVNRTAAEDVEIAGVSIPEGATISLLLGHANRDTKIFDQGERWRTDSSGSAKHIAFGHGIHYCLGAPLVRLEAGILITELLRRFSDLNLVLPPTELDWHKTRITRRPESLRFTATM